MDAGTQAASPGTRDHVAVAARAALVVAGASAVIGQIVLMRELIRVFGGNEISLGVLLAVWLFWTAAGSGLAGLFRAAARPRLVMAMLECLAAASLPVAICEMRAAKSLIETVPGELVGPVPMLFASLACLSVFCVVCGALFVAGARLIEAEGGLAARRSASTAYLLDAAGSGAGGILASLLLVRFLEPLQIAAVVALANVCTALVLVACLRRVQIAVLSMAALGTVVPLLTRIAPRLEHASQARLWRGFDLVASRDTIYGNLTVTSTGSVRSIFSDGSILGNAPDPAAAEEAVDYALLEHPAPTRVLLISGGATGGVAEALKHPSIRQLDYVELDPELIALARRYVPEQAAAFADPRVRVHLADGRRFLAGASEKWDAIIVDVPDPQTAQWNRFYTEEFFRAARAHLAAGGIVAIQLRSSEETISPDLAEFLRSIRRTFGEVFPYQAAIPGEIIHFFGAQEPGVLTADPNVLVARLRERKLNTHYVREYFLPYRMSADRMEQVDKELMPLASTPVNRDFAPVAYAFDVVLWSAQFKSGYAGWFRRAEKIPLPRVAGVVAAALAALVALIILLPGRGRREKAATASCVAATGFTLMALQILLLLAFQSVYGYVYSQLAVLVGLFMAGIALGSWLGMRRAAGNSGLVILNGVPRSRTESKDPQLHSRRAGRASGQGPLAPERRTYHLDLVYLQLLLAFAPPALLLVASLVAGLRGTAAQWIAAEVVFPAMAAGAGVLGGFQFVVAARIYFGEEKRLGEGKSRGGLGALYGLGAFYSVDLLGGCAGALLLSGFLIPVYGFWPTAWLTMGVNLAAAAFAVHNQARLHFSQRRSLGRAIAL